MGEPTLLPCPFCGGEAGVFGYESFMGPRFGCLCGCQIDASSVAKWNRRAPNPLAATLAARDERVRELEAEAEVGRRWAEDSSLERWFPLSVARIVTLEADNATLRGTLIETAKMQHEQMVAREERTKEWEAELAAIRPRAEAAERYAAAARALLEFTDNPPGTKDCWQVHDAAVLETQAAHDALLAACPEKGGAG